MNLISYITVGNLIKTKIYIFSYMLWNTYLLSPGNLLKTKIYIFSYILWNTYFLSSFSSLFFYFTVILTMLCLFFFFLSFFKPKLFYQYLFESLRKQHLTGILLNIQVFILINFTKLCTLLATFNKTQWNFHCGLNIVENYDVDQCQTNVF